MSMLFDARAKGTMLGAYVMMAIDARDSLRILGEGSRTSLQLALVSDAPADERELLMELEMRRKVLELALDDLLSYALTQAQDCVADLAAALDGDGNDAAILAKLLPAAVRKQAQIVALHQEVADA